jgi:hypothetical protein
MEVDRLIYTALLAGSLWIPFILGVNTTDFPGKGQLFIRPPDLGQMKPWVHRSLRAHQNLLEQLLPFSIIVLAGAIGMISGFARLPLRPIIYLAGWIAMLVFAWQVLLRAA